MAASASFSPAARACSPVTSLMPSGAPVIRSIADRSLTWVVLWIALKKNFAPRRDGRHVEGDLETGRLRRQQLVARVLVLAAILRGRRRPSDAEDQTGTAGTSCVSCESSPFRFRNPDPEDRGGDERGGAHEQRGAEAVRVGERADEIRRGGAREAADVVGEALRRGADRRSGRSPPSPRRSR